MPLVPDLDIGATSVGFVVIDQDFDLVTAQIHRLGVRIFPETRDPKGVPLNRKRRQAWLRRHRLCRWQARRRLLRHHLCAVGPPSRRTYFDAAVLVRVQARIEQLAALGRHRQTAAPDTYRTPHRQHRPQGRARLAGRVRGEGRADEDRCAVTGAPRRISCRADFSRYIPSEITESGNR